MYSELGFIPSLTVNFKSKIFEGAFENEIFPSPVQSVIGTLFESHDHAHVISSFSGSNVPFIEYETDLEIGVINSPHGFRTGSIEITITGGWFDNSIVLVSSTQFCAVSHTSKVISWIPSLSGISEIEPSFTVKLSEKAKAPSIFEVHVKRMVSLSISQVLLASKFT